ncbi:AAA family ATPase [Nocardioides sp. LS1]|uniref:ATP-binding protein n=1 Tax=Nocardioides sp. LS1 TaxID=1027620 RepID=UPI000F61925E|nr:adenylate/guanylate cyclase domain-containing protein [Nocardioides sp. LS1]GCD91871.1 guanylate cyclase [Nocardioides sp. LS1]
MGDLGTPDGAACENCGGALAPSAKFCPECGTPVVAAAPEPEVRKTVTLLFTDVTGSTAMGEQLDPEAYRAVMGRYFEVARAAVERHGGTVEKFVGDAVLAVFGIPEIREDDALRAVRAAHELNGSVAALSEELTRTLGVALTIRTGVNTGSVVAGSARAGGSFATGDAVNTAARLEQAAPPGRILLGETTWSLVRDAVEVEAVEPVAAKGKAEPVPAYLLVSVGDADTGRTRNLGAELVGRDRETRTLEDVLERTLESGRSHLVTIVGAPGIGKTRLISDFLARVGDRADVVSGRCVSYGQGITYWPVVQLLRQALGLTGTESEEVTRHALAALVGDTPDGGQVVDLVLPILGGSGQAGGSDQTFWAVRRVLEQLALRRPLVVTVDDLHWAEPTLLELLERVRDEVQDLPLLMICQARPELLDDNPDWGRGSMNCTTFGLEPFTVDQTRHSLAALLGSGVPDEVVEAVAGWAGGNPLFVEEIATHLVETGLLVREGDDWALHGSLDSAQVPPTVAALVAARLDRLPPAERRLLERVSVIGLELTLDDAHTMADGDLDAADVPSLLAALTRRDLLRRVRDLAGESWAFRHVMVRDAAYDALPKAVRAELHQRFAERIEASDGEAGSERLAFVGHHLEQAARYRRELMPGDAATEALVIRAASALGSAGDLARSRQDLTAADALVQRAVDLDVPDLALRRLLLNQLAQLHNDQGRSAELPAVLDRYEAALDATATPLDHAYLHAQRLLVGLEVGEDVDPALVEAAGHEVVRLATESGDHRRVVEGRLVLFHAQIMRAQWAAAERVAVTLAGERGAQDSLLAQIMMGAIVIHGPRPAEDLISYAERQLAEGTGWLTPAGTTRLQLLALTGRSWLDPSVLPDAFATLDRLMEISPTDYLSEMLMAECAMMAGDLTVAIAQLRKSVDRNRALGGLSYVSTYLAWLACSLLELGDPDDEAAGMLAEARGYTSPHDVISVALLAAGDAFLAARRGDGAVAEARATEAIEVVDRGDMLAQQADIRRYAAQVAGERGDRETQRRLLTEARDLYAAKHLHFWVEHVDRLLEELD